jgi:predicted RNA-binding protein
MCALEMVVKQFMEREGSLEDGFVVWDVVGGNPKSQGGVGRVDLVVIYTEIGDHGKQIRIHKHVIPAGRDLSIGGYACVLLWGLSPYLCFGSQINPPIASQQVA